MAPTARPWLIIALACFVALIAALPTVRPARADSLRGDVAPADATAAAGAPSLLHRGMVQFVRLQRDVNKA